MKKQKIINSIYAKAYKEVLEIIKYFSKEEYDKIPKEKIKFYEKNMDKDYNFSIDPEIDLSKQNISPEANAIIINLFTDYFANEEQKTKIKEILEINQQKEEQTKREKYNPDDLFKNKHKESIIEVNDKNLENDTNTALVEYKESFFTRFKNFILRILHINN